MHEAYEKYNGHHGVRISYLLTDADRRHSDSVGLFSYKAYSLRAWRKKDFRLKEGRGFGNEALVRFNALTYEEQAVCIDAFGDPRKAANELIKHYTPDAEARRFFDEFKFEDDTYLKEEQKQRYTTNAGVLNAIKGLIKARSIDRTSRGGTVRKLWATIIADVKDFNNYLLGHYHERHTLPTSNKLKKRYDEYIKDGYKSLVHGNNKNNNAAQVTPQMIQLWMSIYAGQKGLKPDHREVYRRYCSFLSGKLEIISQSTGELYDRTAPEYTQVSETTVFNYQNLWENEAGAHLKRSGNAQVFKGKYIPYHKLSQPKFAGSIISIDDRQPPFEYAPGRRMWFYNGIDLASEFFVCAVWGETKEGIIKEFYRQLVRNYAEWGLKLPYELEAEMSLNSSFLDTFLKPGAMFQEVRIEANNARGKRIEAYYRQLRYAIEKQHMGWLARPFALDEANQKGPEKPVYIPKEEIILQCLRDIEDWNNSLHSNQELYPGLTRYNVFLQHQHPDLKPTNWAGILPYLGYPRKTSMKAGRIILQKMERVVGFNGEVATGETLINVLKQIEGKEVMVYYLDDDNGNVLKSLVYTMDGQLVCELLGDLKHNRAKLEQTDEDRKNAALTERYKKTVESYIRQYARAIEPVLLIEKREEQERQFKFTIPGLRRYQPSEEPAAILPPAPEDDYDMVPVEAPRRKTLAERF